jgi:hypothetical protein
MADEDPITDLYRRIGARSPQSRAELMMSAIVPVSDEAYRTRPQPPGRAR